MKNKIKGFFAGVIITSLMMTSMFVYASEGTSMIEVVFNKINIAVNNSIVGVEGENYLLSSGAEVPNSILYKGTTYLPLRKVAELLGKEVTWDGLTSTAGINEAVAEEVSAEEIVEKEVVEIPREYTAALNKAKTYANTMHMSKASVYNQLVSEYGEKFPEDAAQYAMDNLEADWKENALSKANTYASDMNMSKAAVYNQLISEYGEKFTEEEGQYARDNVEADWKENALNKARTYANDMDMSDSAVYNQLVSEYGEKFTEEEARYAMDNL
jgi:ribosomal protein L17